MPASTRLVLATAWLSAMSPGCVRAATTSAAATSAAAASTPSHLRSPSLDYREGPRWSTDGEVMGAHGHSVDDWMLGNATTAHGAPGWAIEDGRLRFRREWVAPAHGASFRAPPCAPPATGALTPEQEEARAELQRAWLSAARPPPLPVVARVAAAAASETPELLSCNTQ